MPTSDLLKILSDAKIQGIISENRNISGAEFILKFASENGLPIKEIAEQIDCRKKAEKKLPGLRSKNLIYKKVSLEQCSSELTAEYKSKKIKGKRLIDLTGGLGIDSIYFSKSFDEVIYCEMNEELAEVAEYNFRTLGINNIIVKKGDGIKILKEFENNYFDWIFADPSRRDKDKRSVDIKYYSPDVVSNMDLFFQKSKNICLKLAPAFDIKEAARIFSAMNEFSVVSVKNECKEVLIIINKEKKEKIKSAVILSEENEPIIFEGKLNKNYEIEFSPVEKEMFFYEPDAGIRKSDLTKFIANEYNLKFINLLSDYLISEKDIKDFPGRKFKILFADFYNEKKVKQYLTKEIITKANIARSNFPQKPEIIKEKLKLKDGGDNYLFFTKDKNDKNIFISAIK